MSLSDWERVGLSLKRTVGEREGGLVEKRERV